MYATAGLSNSIHRAKTDIGDILQSGQYYCNEEIARELTAINNGLEHMNLDSKLRKSREGSEPATAVDCVAGYLNDYKSRMGATNVLDKQENQIRMLNQWAITNLRNAQQNLMPHTTAAAEGIRQFGDSVGVTDRFMGYRNNLTRIAREPDPSLWAERPGLTRAHTTIGASRAEQRFGDEVVHDYGVMGKNVSFGSSTPAAWTLKGYRTVDSLYPKSTCRTVNGALRPSTVMADVRAMNTLNARSLANTDCRQETHDRPVLMTKPSTAMSAQEKAGINTEFPGSTEYKSRYLRQPMNIPTSHFVINPTPNFSVNGRPLALVRYYPISTEYQNRYMWPDGNRIVKLPWLRK